MHDRQLFLGKVSLVVKIDILKLVNPLEVFSNLIKSCVFTFDMLKLSDFDDLDFLHFLKAVLSKIGVDEYLFVFQPLFKISDLSLTKYKVWVLLSKSFLFPTRITLADFSWIKAFLKHLDQPKDIIFYLIC